MMKGRYAMAIGLIFLAILLLYSRGALSQTLSNIRLSHVEEPFTELYFQDYANLPKTEGAIAKGEEVSFSFILHNQEGKDMVYPYVIYIASAEDEEIVIEEGILEVKNGSLRTIDYTYSFLNAHQAEKEFKIGVLLTSLNQEIHFSL